MVDSGDVPHSGKPNSAPAGPTKGFPLGPYVDRAMTGQPDGSKPDKPAIPAATDTPSLTELANRALGVDPTQRQPEAPPVHQPGPLEPTEEQIAVSMQDRQERLEPGTVLLTGKSLAEIAKEAYSQASTSSADRISQRLPIGKNRFGLLFQDGLIGRLLKRKDTQRDLNVLAAHQGYAKGAREALPYFLTQIGREDLARQVVEYMARPKGKYGPGTLEIPQNIQLNAEQAKALAITERTNLERERREVLTTYPDAQLVYESALLHQNLQEPEYVERRRRNLSQKQRQAVAQYAEIKARTNILDGLLQYVVRDSTGKQSNAAINQMIPWRGNSGAYRNDGVGMW